MVTEDCMNRVLPVVADSWEQLRRCDVERLLHSIHYVTVEGLYQAAEIVKAKRPDLADTVSQEAEVLTNYVDVDWASGSQQTEGPEGLLE